MRVKSDTLLSAWGAFFVAHALSIQKIERELSDNAPLSLYEYDVLLTIERTPEKKIRYSDLATKSIFTKSGITRIMKRLESRGFIEREKCESDARGAFARLNKDGAKALKDTWAIYSKEILKIMEPALTQSDGIALETIMGKIIDELSGPAVIKIGRKNFN
jgi:DNA-binding MarR family transcriptional regulator